MTDDLTAAEQRAAEDSFSSRDAAFWARIERLDAEAEDDVRHGRFKPVTDEFIQQLWDIVRRRGAGG